MTAPARLHVLLARQSPVGLVLRRGPAKSVCTIGWNRETDEFQLGQWLRGRIYERRCDLSPDGRHFIYFARKGSFQSETKGSYTAISRAPYLHAISLYGKGDCWQGGGLFTSNKSFWLNGCHFPLREDAALKPDTAFRPPPYGNSECLGVYYPRLLRDGWTIELNVTRGAYPQCTVFTKPLPKGWLLRKFALADPSHPVGTGVYWDEHELENLERKIILPCPSWEWAELDYRSIVYAEKGVLYRVVLAAEGLAPATLLHDFNPMRFEQIKAPY